LHLVLTLLWIFVCMLFTNWVSLPATLGAMVSALGIFVFYEGDVGGTLGFYVAYDVNFLIAACSVAVIHSLRWELNTRRACRQRAVGALAGAGYRVLAPDQLLLGRNDAREDACPVNGPQSRVEHIVVSVDALCLDTVDMAGTSQGA